jgi:hypothetical protein
MIICQNELECWPIVKNNESNVLTCTLNAIILEQNKLECLPLKSNIILVWYLQVKEGVGSTLGDKLKADQQGFRTLEAYESLFQNITFINETPAK